MKKNIKLFLPLLILTLSHQLVFAWGGRGHFVICSAASFLVKSPELKNYLQSRSYVMGHLCNIPDNYWRTLDSQLTQLGDPTHYIDPEITGLKIKDVPADFKVLVEKYTGKPNQFKKGATIFSIPREFGSLWWRADQFVRRATSLENDWKKTKKPINAKEEQDANLEYNKLAYDFFINLGLLGHYVGDASQPFHATSDYDGYHHGHGGIHAYYEADAVDAIDYKLESKVIAAAEKILKANNSPIIKEKTTIEKMRALSEVSLSELDKIFAIDPVQKASEVKNEKGMEIRTAAIRAPIKTVAKKFEPLIIQQLARSAALLATLWEEAYKKVGSPALHSPKIYKFPFMPDFVAPDYVDEKTPEK